MSALLDQSGMSVHRVSRSASDLHVTERRVCRDGRRGDDIGAAGGRGSEARGESRSADGGGEGSEGRAERDEGGEGPAKKRDNR